MARERDRAREDDPEAVVLDAQAVPAFLDDEPGAEAVNEALRLGEPRMDLVNLGELT